MTDEEFDALTCLVEEWSKAHVDAASFVVVGVQEPSGAGTAFAMRGDQLDEDLARHFSEDLATMALVDETNMILAGMEPASSDTAEWMLMECASDFLDGLEAYTLHGVSPARLALYLQDGIRRGMLAIASKPEPVISRWASQDLYLVRIRKLCDAVALLRETDWARPIFAHPGLEES